MSIPNDTGGRRDELDLSPETLQDRDVMVADDVVGGFRSYATGLRPMTRWTAARSVAEVTGDIAAALAEREPTIEAASLAGGLAGIALFHAYTGDERRAVACLERAVSAIRVRALGPSLCDGYAGVAWTVEHLRRRGIGAQRDRCASVDEALLRLVDRAPWTGEYDLLYGLVGLGVYAYERLPHQNGVRLLTAVVERLAETAVGTPAGVTWESRAEWIAEPYRDGHPVRSYNLGMAHGVPGAVGLLGLACGAGVAEDTARPLLRDAVEWLLAQRLPGPAGCYPRWLAEDEQPDPARTAWCYGDPGVAAALALAGRHAGESAWVAAATEIASVAAARPEAETGVVDASVCHGSAGLGLIFHRLAAVTGGSALREAASSWVGRTLAMRRPGTGVAGFETRDVDAGGEHVWAAQPGLLTGAAGVGLVLHTLARGGEGAWDRWLLVS